MRLQFIDYGIIAVYFAFVLGIVPLVIVGLKNVGGWSGIQAQLEPQFTHVWRYMATEGENPMGVALWQMALGLGFVLSFGSTRRPGPLTHSPSRP